MPQGNARSITVPGGALAVIDVKGEAAIADIQLRNACRAERPVLSNGGVKG